MTLFFSHSERNIIRFGSLHIRTKETEQEKLRNFWIFYDSQNVKLFKLCALCDMLLRSPLISSLYNSTSTISIYITVREPGLRYFIKVETLLFSANRKWKNRIIAEKNQKFQNEETIWNIQKKLLISYCGMQS